MGQAGRSIAGNRSMREAAGMARAIPKIAANRTPVLPLWATVVGDRLSSGTASGVTMV